MKFEIWTFSDDKGVAWHLEQCEGPSSNYQAFMRHVNEQPMKAEKVHTFEADSEVEARKTLRSLQFGE